MNEVLKKLQELESFAFIHFGNTEQKIMSEYLDKIESIRKDVKQLEKDLKKGLK